MPGKVFGTGTMQPIDYCVELAEGAIEPPANLDLATIQQQELAKTFRYHIPQYLSAAPPTGGAGFAETLVDFADAQCPLEVLGRRPARRFQELGGGADPRNPLDGRQGVNERIMLRELLRRVDMMVILENHLDALVRLHTPCRPAGSAAPPECSPAARNCRRSR